MLTIPLAVYRHPSKGIIYLTEGAITKTMRSIAATVYNLDLAKDRVKFSLHSLRVGACTILHSRGFTPIQIKFLLRWKSDAFMTYLWNVATLSLQQNEAINLMDHMPNLFK